MIMRMLEEVRAQGDQWEEQRRCMLYDVLVCENWQRRLEEQDPEFDIEKAVMTKDKEIWQMAETRLPSTLQAAGLTRPGRAPPFSAGPVSAGGR